MEFLKRKVTLKNDIVSFWDTNNTSPQNTVLLLAAGASDGSMFKEMVEATDFDSTRFIAPDFPGRGESVYNNGKENQIEKAAIMTVDLLNNLGVLEYSVIAVSFGTMVLDKLLLLTQQNISRVTLAAPGEYFNETQRIFLKTIFSPAKNKKVQEIYKKVLKLNLKSLDSVDTEEILRQWWDTLSYKIVGSENKNVPVTIIKCTKDSIVNKNSLESLKKLYPEAKYVEIASPHPVRQNDIKMIVSEAFKVHFEGFSS